MSAHVKRLNNQSQNHQQEKAEDSEVEGPHALYLQGGSRHGGEEPRSMKTPVFHSLPLLKV